MYIQIDGATLEEDNIKVTRVGLYDSDGVRTRRLSLNGILVYELTKGKIQIVEGLFPNPILDETNLGTPEASIS